MADLLATGYISAKKLLVEFAAHGLEKQFPPDGEVIDDGASADGRPIATNAKVLELVAMCQALINWVETGTSDASKPQTTEKVFAITALAINGTSKF